MLRFISGEWVVHLQFLVDCLLGFITVEMVGWVELVWVFFFGWIGWYAVFGWFFAWFHQCWVGVWLGWVGLGLIGYMAQWGSSMTFSVLVIILKMLNIVFIRKQNNHRFRNFLLFVIICITTRDIANQTHSLCNILCNN